MSRLRLLVAATVVAVLWPAPVSAAGGTAATADPPARPRAVATSALAAVHRDDRAAADSALELRSERAGVRVRTAHRLRRW